MPEATGIFGNCPRLCKISIELLTTDMQRRVRTPTRFGKNRPLGQRLWPSPVSMLKRHWPFPPKKKTHNFMHKYSVRDAFYKSLKAKSQRAIGLHSCEIIFIIFAPWYVNFSRQKIALNAVIYMICYIFFDNGVMTTPKRRILSFVFTFLCFKKSLLIRKKNRKKPSSEHYLTVVDWFIQSSQLVCRSMLCYVVC